MIKGQVRDISLQPILAKDLPKAEREIPAQVDLRNLRFTDKGTPNKRRGYAEKWDTTNEFPVSMLIPEVDGYAIDSNGNVYNLDTVLNIGNFAPVTTKPTYFKWDSIIYIYAGVPPVKIVSNSLVLVGNNIPSGKFAIMINTYAIIAGYNPTEFTWLVPGNPESNVVGDGAGFANVQKTGTIQNLIEYKNKAYFFKEREIEVYAPTGVATSPFRVQQGLRVDKGLGAVDSVVKANDTFYWLGDDGDFYVYDGGLPRVISDNMRARIDEGANPSKWVGFDIRKENSVMWTNPVDGITLLYDYSKNKWIEDSRWEGSGWQALPFASYMELKSRQYFGSRNQDGKIHEWSDDNLDDNGLPIRVFRQVKVPLSKRRNSATVHKLKFKFKRGVATSGESTPEVTIRTRFDQGDWVTWPNLSLGTVGVYAPYVELNRIGIGRELEVEIAEMDAVEFLMTNMLMTFQEHTQ